MDAFLKARSFSCAAALQPQNSVLKMPTLPSRDEAPLKSGMYPPPCAKSLDAHRSKARAMI